MKKAFLLSLVLVLAAYAALRPSQLWQLRDFDFGPKTVPSSSEIVTEDSVYLRELDLVNPSGSPVTVDIVDGNSLSVVKVSVPALGFVHRVYLARFCQDGISWSASSDGVIVGYVRVLK